VELNELAKLNPEPGYYGHPTGRQKPEFIQEPVLRVCRVHFSRNHERTSGNQLLALSSQ
jgi:hypothetical protein